MPGHAPKPQQIRLASTALGSSCLVLGAMLLVSALPLGLYHFQVLRLSQEKLTDTESVQQTEVTRSVGEEIQLFDANLYQQLISERQILALTGPARPRRTIPCERRR